MNTERQSQIEDSKRSLLAVLKPGDTVYCILRRRSRSGMERDISLAVISHGEIRRIDLLSARLLGLRLSAGDGVTVRGVGTDVARHLVDALGCALGFYLRHQWL